jgi:hypothetical protein
MLAAEAGKAERAGNGAKGAERGEGDKREGVAAHGAEFRTSCRLLFDPANH